MILPKYHPIAEFKNDNTHKRIFKKRFLGPLPQNYHSLASILCPFDLNRLMLCPLRNDDAGAYVVTAPSHPLIPYSDCTGPGPSGGGPKCSCPLRISWPSRVYSGTRFWFVPLRGSVSLPVPVSAVPWDIDTCRILLLVSAAVR